MKRIFLVLVLFFIVEIAFCQSPEAIVRKAYILGNDQNINVKIDMTIRAINGTKKRLLDVYIKRSENSSKILLHIISPAFLNKMKFLVHRNPHGIESRWMKTSKGTRRLSDANNSERVFDSDFTVEDFSDVRTEDFRFSFLDSILIDNEECYTIEAVPLYKNSIYSRKILKIGKDSMILREVDFYDRDGELIKRYKLLDSQIVNTKIYPLFCRMDDLRKGTDTTLHLNQVNIVKNLPDKIFNKGNL